MGWNVGTGYLCYSHRGLLWIGWNFFIGFALGIFSETELTGY